MTPHLAEQPQQQAREVLRLHKAVLDAQREALMASPDTTKWLADCEKLGNAEAAFQAALAANAAEIERLTKALEPFAKVGAIIEAKNELYDRALTAIRATKDGPYTAITTDHCRRAYYARRAQQPSPAAEGGEDER
jgi:hypothetical protein